jgi:hypothetical protein
VAYINLGEEDNLDLYFSDISLLPPNMKLYKPSIIATLLGRALGAAGGFYIDPDLEDGEYRFELPDDETSKPLLIGPRGPQLHSPFRDPIDKPRKYPPPFHVLKKRGGTGQMSYIYNEDTKRVEDVQADLYHAGVLPLPHPEKRCHHDSHYPTVYYDMNADDYRASKQSLFNWCDLYGFRSGHVELSLQGSVAVYVCQPKVVMVGPNRCSEGEYLAAEALMNETCGELKPAKVFIKEWNKEYGRSFKGSHVCGRHGDHLILPGAKEGAIFGKDEYKKKPSRKKMDEILEGDREPFTIGGQRL